MDWPNKAMDLNTLQEPAAAAVVRRIVDGYKAHQVLRAGYDSGLFDWLAKHGPTEKAAIGAALNLRGTHLGAFLQALEDLGLLVHHGAAFALAGGMAQVLCSTSPWCQAEWLQTLQSPNQGWADMGHFMNETWQQQVPQSWSSVALHPYLPEAQALSALLAQRPRPSCGGAATPSLLCFDGSDGLLAAALCQVDPTLQATVVVAADALAQAEALLTDCGVADRCHLLTGTPLDAAMAGPTHDRVVLFHSLYPVRKNVSDALAVAAACVAPGGELCCVHWFCLEACESAPGGLRDLDKAVLTNSHPLCGVEKFPQRLQDVGLVDVQRQDLPGRYGNAKLYFAHRPGGGCHCD